MARFETPCQIVSLFIGAAGVAVLIILFLNAEVRHRNSEHAEESVMEDDIDGLGYSFYSNILDRMAEMVNEEEEGTENRRVRRDLSDVVHNELSEALLSEAVSGHKVRNIADKIMMAGEESQLVKTVLDLYCPPQELTFYTCNQTTTTTESPHSYNDSVISFVDNMTRKLSPDQDHSPSEQECMFSSFSVSMVIVMTATVTTIFNICVGKIIQNITWSQGDKLSDQLLFEEDEMLRQKPIVKDDVNVILSPYENI